MGVGRQHLIVASTVPTRARPRRQPPNYRPANLPEVLIVVDFHFYSSSRRSTWYEIMYQPIFIAALQRSRVDFTLHPPSCDTGGEAAPYQRPLDEPSGAPGDLARLQYRWQEVWRVQPEYHPNGCGTIGPRLMRLMKFTARLARLQMFKPWMPSPFCSSGAW